MVTTARQTALITLQFCWGGVYQISVRGREWIGVLEADRTVVLRAGSSGKLREMLEVDHGQRSRGPAGRSAESCSC